MTKKQKNSESYKRQQRLKALTELALNRYSMEEIMLALYEAGDWGEFENAATLASDDLINANGPGDKIVIDMKGKGMNYFDKLQNFLTSEIFPFANEQSQVSFLF